MDRWLIRLATLAGPEPRFLRVLGCRMKLNILRPGEACRTGGTAVHAHGLDRVEKLAICICIAGNDGCPPWVILGRGRKFGSCGRDLRRYLHRASVRRSDSLTSIGAV